MCANCRQVLPLIVFLERPAAWRCVPVGRARECLVRCAPTLGACEVAGDSAPLDADGPLAGGQMQTNHPTETQGTRTQNAFA